MKPIGKHLVRVKHSKNVTVGEKRLAQRSSPDLVVACPCTQFRTASDGPLPPEWSKRMKNRDTVRIADDECLWVQCFPNWPKSAAEYRQR